MNRKTTALIILAAGLLISVSGCEDAKKQSSSSKDSSHLDRYFTVEPRDIVIGVEESGTVNSLKNHKIRYEASYRTQISWVIDENSEVEEGEVLVKFDDEELVSQVDEYENQLENSRKELSIAKEELEIQKSENEANLRQARDRVTDAEEELSKFLRLEGPKLRDEQTVEVENAREALDEAEQAYEEAYEEHQSTVYDNQEEKNEAEDHLETLKGRIEREEINYENVLIDDKIFKRYTYRNRITTLENNLEQSRLDLKKTQVRADSSLIQKQNQIQRHKNDIQRLEKELKRHREYLSMMELTSPVDGVVLYGDTDDRWRDEEPTEGMDVRRGEVLLTIPDLSQLMIDMDLPEIYRSRVNMGDEAVITVESIQGLSVKGEVSDISPLPVNQLRWDPASPKIYETRITVPEEEKNERMVTGMNVQAKIISQRLKDVLAVPIEAVFEKDGRLFVYRTENGSPEVVYVEIGPADDDFVSIEKGLDAGDKVCLFEPVE
ncbi:Putative efflux system component YknX [Sedimentisphaera cyanobacteriorum]|uniref:Efflux system component YknX n=1 Tax=Sedimentisphaera cyanobacteriorum TaxID=1940790 RepID=A0A1Q2HNY7_9BACT|nr:efflux RND transporter periplasmic adaptor subunit [Sedimentisphaera cyanobacteriorum]AQQ09070.1 Putative efflux system component YknX [Sedimentisphaera cyanobacteriorum]